MTSAPWLEYAESIKIVNLSDSLTNIITDAFRWCNHMTSIEIPNSVTSIGQTAFLGCTGLTEVTCEAVTPPTLGLGAFYQVNQSDCALYVPSASIDLYKAADQWKDFYNILALEEANEIVSDTKPSSKILHNGHIIIRSDKTYTITGQQVKLYDY